MAQDPRSPDNPGGEGYSVEVQGGIGMRCEVLPAWRFPSLSGCQPVLESGVVSVHAGFSKVFSNAEPLLAVFASSAACLM